MKVKVIDHFLPDDKIHILEQSIELIEHSYNFGLFYNIVDGDFYGRKINWTISREGDVGFKPEVAVIGHFWEEVSKLIDKRHVLTRAYVNAHFYGIEDRVHVDEEHKEHGLTALIYLNEDWQAEWNGATAFYKSMASENNEILKCVLPRHNRLLIFNKSIPHQVMPLSRRFTGVRLTLMFRIELLEGPVEELSLFQDDFH